ncbi:OLC1v1013517C1 [Oldenlandia corymbosa var. corymbosa]|uniref:OLC1v1013517C1 n=1 Tax=Oldenlandia corymbosa var. corymbosa TaxID=529605 RepID=A0AAV1DZA0_OLDCO|nr:OLC1v1013517C1 [Oldenlandia corymbosa var. corymbosa]
MSLAKVATAAALADGPQPKKEPNKKEADWKLLIKWLKKRATRRWRQLAQLEQLAQGAKLLNLPKFLYLLVKLTTYQVAHFVEIKIVRSELFEALYIPDQLQVSIIQVE